MNVDRRQSAPPVLQVRLTKRLPHLVRICRRHPEGRKDSDDRVGGHPVPFPLLVPILDPDPMATRKIGQRLIHDGPGVVGPGCASRRPVPP